MFQENAVIDKTGQNKLLMCQLYTGDEFMIKICRSGDTDKGEMEFSDFTETAQLILISDRLNSERIDNLYS